MKKLIIAVALAASSVAHAEFLDGNKLLQMMHGDAHDASFALGYVTGVADAISGVSSCHPAQATTGQLRDIVRKWLINNPEHRQHTADIIISAVLQNTWPCKRKPSQSQSNHPI